MEWKSINLDEMRTKIAKNCSPLKPKLAYKCISRFTLIELLVVITIIAILAAMLLPTLARTRALARQTVCLNNQKQVCLAYFHYADDWDGYWPVAKNEDINQDWKGYLCPYIYGPTVRWNWTDIWSKPRGVLYGCPEWIVPVGAEWKCGYGMNINARFPTNHPYTSAWYSAWAAGWLVGKGRFFRMDEWNYPDKHILFGDSNHDWALWASDASGSPPYRYVDPTSIRHLKKAVYGFVDGHVSVLDPIEAAVGILDPNKTQFNW